MQTTMEKELFSFLAQYMTLTEEEKRTLIDLDIFRSFKKGTILLSEGQRSEEEYFVMQGCIRCYYVIDGEEKTTAFYTESESLSPQCFGTKQPSKYYVACVEDSTLIVSNASMEAVVFEKFPRFQALCLLLTEDLLAKNQATLDEFKTSSPEERYLSLLQNRPDLVQRVPQHQLASYLGITPQSLSRIRKRLVVQEK
jgi:CRP-like cAMP-binding protein